MNPNNIPAKITKEFTVKDLSIVHFLFDAHIGSTNSPKEFDMSDVINYIENAKKQNPQALFIYGGDNVEIRNSLEELVDQAIGIREELLTYFDAESLGNHDGGTHNMRNYIRIKVLDSAGRVYKTYIIGHGDWESNPERYYKQRDSLPGASKFKRNVIVNALEALEQIMPNKFSKKYLANCTRTLDETGGDVLVLGHKHFRKIESRQHAGNVIKGMPRYWSALVMS